MFRILPRDFTEESGQLTPSLKLKRNVVLKEFADEIEALYSGGGTEGLTHSPGRRSTALGALRWTPTSP